MRSAIINILLATSLVTVPAIASAAPKGCPPGLAKKSPACVPPGQAKKQITRDDDRDALIRYRVGERIGEDYIIIRDPDRYGLRTDGTYVRSNDYVYQIDRETREVINLIGAIGAILN